MNHRPLGKTAFGVLIASVAFGTIGATTLIKFSFGEMARRSERVVVGSVTGLRPQWDDSRSFIHTEVSVAVERDLRGRGGGQLVLRTPGGDVGGFGMIAVGGAEFTIGERVLLFLTKWEDGAYKVLGYSQGKSSVFVDANGTERLRGGVAGGRSLQGVAGELEQGPDHAIPLVPAKRRRGSR